jgi:hypothetical protein
MATVTHNWSDSRLSKASGNWTATESWVVTDVASKSEAIDAAVAHNEQHPDNANLRAYQRDAAQVGPLAWRVTAQYRFGEFGPGEDDPLNEPIEIDWQFIKETLPIDRDVDNNAIVNSAGDPYDPPPSRVYAHVALVIRRNEPLFSAATALAYIDKVNAAPITIAGAGTLDTEQMLCDMIAPASSYRADAEYVPVVYRFILKPGTRPHQLRTVDQGRNGWYQDGSDTKPGAIVDGEGNPVLADVRLDGTGKPINAQYKITGGKETPVATATLPAGLDVDDELSTADVKYLGWTVFQTADFTALGL